MGIAPESFEYNSIAIFLKYNYIMRRDIIEQSVARHVVGSAAGIIGTGLEEPLLSFSISPVSAF